MNSSHLVDKQVTMLSARPQSGDLLDLMDAQEERQNHGGAIQEEELLPSYDFQPIQTVGSWPPMNAGLDGASKKIGSSGLRVTVLSGRSQSSNLLGLMDPQEECQNHGGMIKGEEILPSYEFQPIRTVGSWPPMNAGLNVASKKMGSSSLGYSSILEPHEISKVNHEKEGDTYDVARVVEIDRVMKKYADNLLHALEGVGSRLSQLESRTCYLKSSVDELKVSTVNNHGSTDGKLRQLENILREVQTSVQILRDKQDIAEVQLQLAKLQASKGEQSPEKASTGQPDSRQRVPPPQPVQQPLQTPAAPPQPSPHPSVLIPNAPPPSPQQNLSPIPCPIQLPQSQMPTAPSAAEEPYLAPPVQSTYTTHLQYQMPVQQSQPPPPEQHQQASQLQQPFSQPIQTAQPPNPSPQLQPPLPHPPEENAPYMPPSQSYPPSICQPAPYPQPSARPPSTLQFYAPNTSMYETPASRPSLVHIPYSAGYSMPAGPSFSEPFACSGSPSHYSCSTMKPSPFSSSAPSLGSSSHQHLSAAKVLPQALPTESSSSGSTGNGVPIDDVVEKVATMGFSRDQVRETVQKLTENGQSVDLNAVLDKLMNDGEIQPLKGWFGR